MLFNWKVPLNKHFVESQLLIWMPDPQDSGGRDFLPALHKHPPLNEHRVSAPQWLLWKVITHWKESLWMKVPSQPELKSKQLVGKCILAWTRHLGSVMATLFLCSARSRSIRQMNNCPYLQGTHSNKKLNQQFLCLKALSYLPSYRRDGFVSQR